MITEDSIERFYADLEAMRITKPVAALAKASGLSTGNVSEYLNRIKKPSKRLMDAFYEKLYDSSKIVPHEKTVVLEPVGVKPETTFERLIVNLLEQQNRILEKQNSILERQNAEVMDKLKGVQEEMASKADVIGLKKDLTRQLGEINLEMTDGISSVLKGLKSLTSSAPKEPVPSGTLRKR